MRPRADATHGFDSVHQQIQQHLLHLDAVAQDQRHIRCEVRLDHDPVAVHFAGRQGEDVPDRGVEVEPVLLGRRFLGEVANPTDDFARAMAFGNHPQGGLPGFLQVLRGEPAHAGTGASAFLN